MDEAWVLEDAKLFDELERLGLDPRGVLRRWDARRGPPGWVETAVLQRAPPVVLDPSLPAAVRSVAGGSPDRRPVTEGGAPPSPASSSARDAYPDPPQRDVQRVVPSPDRASRLELRGSLFMAAAAFVLDVESIGLHGEGFAAGYVVVDLTEAGGGRELDSGIAWTPPGNAKGSNVGLAWVEKNVPQLSSEGAMCYSFCRSPRQVRDWIWDRWIRWKTDTVHGPATLWADCAWPVEARFLAACVDDDPEGRTWKGPFPLEEIATFRGVVWHRFEATEPAIPRDEKELPKHNPLFDARHSARELYSLLRGL